MIANVLFQVNADDQLAGLLGGTTSLLCAGIMALVTIVGWLAIIPIVNGLVYIDIAGKPMRWIILLFIPLVNIIVLFLIHQVLAERFGQGILFALGLLFFTPLFALLLGFGDYEYR